KQNSKQVPDLDTQVLLDYLAQLLEHSSLEESLFRIYQEVEGVVNLATVIPSRKTLILSSNTGSLYWMEDEKETIYFASEKIFLEELHQKFYAPDDVPQI